MHYFSSSTHNGMSGGWGPMMQERDIRDLPPRGIRSPYTPTWHLQGPPSVCNAHAAYVEGIPSASTMGREMGHMAPPPYQLAPPPPPRSSEAQQLLVLTPWDQSTLGATSEAEANSMTTAMEGESQARMPPSCLPPYQCMPPPTPQLAQTHDQLLMPPPQQPPKKWQTCRVRMTKMQGLLTLI